LNTTAAGKVVVTATIIDGTEVGEDLFESFIIDVLPAPVPLVPADMTMMIAIGAIVAAMIAVTIFVMMHARSVLTKCDAKENKTKNKAKRQYKAGPEGKKNEHAGPILQDGSLHHRH
ncbi:MAG: hypothetical protein FWG19_04355, partial [Methanomassiliicoccaceae archaeon]|nr:hypothetical protein [Methanomassiliicoccaceae archaeon]